MFYWKNKPLSMLSHKKVTVKKLNTITYKLTYVKNICSAHLVLITSVLTQDPLYDMKEGYFEPT